LFFVVACAVTRDEPGEDPRDEGGDGRRLGFEQVGIVVVLPS